MKKYAITFLLTTPACVTGASGGRNAAVAVPDWRPFGARNAPLRRHRNDETPAC